MLGECWIFVRKACSLWVFDWVLLYYDLVLRRSLNIVIVLFLKMIGCSFLAKVKVVGICLHKFPCACERAISVEMVLWPSLFFVLDHLIDFSWLLSGLMRPGISCCTCVVLFPWVN